MNIFTFRDKAIHTINTTVEDILKTQSIPMDADPASYIELLNIAFRNTFSEEPKNG